MTNHLEPSANGFLVRETRRLYARYQLEFVEAHNLCPWARRASLEGKVRVEVELQPDFDLAPTLAAVDRFTADLDTEIGLLIFPLLDISRAEFERWVASIVTADAQRMGLSSPAFALAAFHPQALPDISQAERLVPFVRRTPDPTIQLVRISALERVRKGDVGGTHYFDPRTFDFGNPTAVRSLFGESRESLRERISNANLNTLQTLTIQRAAALLDEITEDRARVHSAYRWQTNRRANASTDDEGHD